MGLRRGALVEIGFSEVTDEVFEAHPRFRGRGADETITMAPYSETKSGWRQNILSSPLGGWAKIFRGAQSIWLNGSQRLAMLPAESGANLQAPEQPLAKLFVDDARRFLFQSAVFAGIGQYPVLDSVRPFGTFSRAFASEKPDPAVERGLGPETLRVFEKTLQREAASDGFNAYVGMLGALYASDYKAILIDEGMFGILLGWPMLGLLIRIEKGWQGLQVLDSGCVIGDKPPSRAGGDIWPGYLLISPQMGARRPR